VKRGMFIAALTAAGIFQAAAQEAAVTLDEAARRVAVKSAEWAAELVPPAQDGSKTKALVLNFGLPPAKNRNSRSGSGSG